MSKFIKNSLPFATCLDIVRHWQGELTKDGLEKVFSRLSREAGEGWPNTLNGYELAGCADRANVLIRLPLPNGTIGFPTAQDLDRFAKEINRWLDAHK